ncbi:hypothetical protein EJ04DRAFT_578293 [Polyplosphaeria fusca]|uniref:Uncharacterized protein n=1 Tax=Polyplosphaeria fusca TaxID=682080 RepID=A0A9P4V0Z1_9PLEO|nr:hypothetical protein EJ04DRAFT_578293 [Polyplosphaeria fusca]
MLLSYLFLAPLLPTLSSAYVIIVYTYTWSQSGNSTSRQILDGGYNAIFNGSLTMKMTADGDASCNMEDTVGNYSMQIGAINPGGNSSLSRKRYDTNPYYFALEGPASEADAGTFLALESSRDMSENATAAESVFWQVTSTKNNGGFDTKGTFALYSEWNSQALNSNCEGSFSGNVDPINNWTMTGRIEEGKVNFTFGPAPWDEDGVHYVRTWSFEGVFWDQGVDGAKLVFNGDSIETQGKYVNKTNATTEQQNSAPGATRVWSWSWALLIVTGLASFM